MLHNNKKMKKGNAQSSQKVILDLTCDVQDRNHVVCMDNFFNAISLFRDLLAGVFMIIGAISCITSAFFMESLL